MERGSDQELVRQALSGDERGFEELLRRYQTVLHRFFLQRHSHEEALDLLQETFLRAWQSLGRYQPQWAFSTWLFTIAYRQSVSHFRKKRGWFSQSFFQEPTMMEQIAAPLPEETDEESAEVENLWTLAKTILPEAQWSALWLFYAEEKSVREIAHILRRTETGVKTLLFRGRKKLQAQYNRKP
ncbi:MAG: RNA polymerase sigma factor [Planctomycetia bacterium]|nr:RNA polymerase sigma factor [Planctomycetia bacterium]